MSNVETWVRKAGYGEGLSLLNSAWYLCFGIPNHILCDPDDKIMLEGHLMKYKPGVDNVYISRWCQLTRMGIFRVYKDQISSH